MNEEQEIREAERKEKRQDFIKRMFPAMLCIFAFMAFYVLYGGVSTRNVDELMFFMVISVGLATFIAIDPGKFSYFFVRLLAVSLFAITLWAMFISLFLPEYLGFSEESTQREVQIFTAVASAGMMGGLMKYFSHGHVIQQDIMNLWHIIHSAIVGLFVSLVLFMILRAGIINQTQIDTFNVWGVTGVSAITGFFAERVIERFSSLYNEVVGNQNNGTNSSS